MNGVPWYGWVIGAVTIALILATPALAWVLYSMRWRWPAMRAPSAFADVPVLFRGSATFRGWEPSTIAQVLNDVHRALTTEFPKDREKIADLFARLIIEVLPEDADVITNFSTTGWIVERRSVMVPAAPQSPGALHVGGSIRLIRWWWWGERKLVAVVAQRPTAYWRERGVVFPTASQAYLQHEIIRHLFAYVMGRGLDAEHALEDFRAAERRATVPTP